MKVQEKVCKYIRKQAWLQRTPKKSYKMNQWILFNRFQCQLQKIRYALSTESKKATSLFKFMRKNLSLTVLIFVQSAMATMATTNRLYSRKVEIYYQRKLLKCY